jgi:hypothetical protein
VQEGVRMLQFQPRPTAGVGHRRHGARPAVGRLAPMPRAHLYKIDHYSVLTHARHLHEGAA